APGSARLRMALATALARAGHDRPCADELAAALRLAPAAELGRYRPAAPFAALEPGELDAAFAHGAAGLRCGPDAPSVPVALADLCLWTGDIEAARRRAQAAPGPIGQAGARRIEGQLALAAGDGGRARVELDGACRVDDP